MRVEIGEAVECRDAVIDEALRHRRLQVRANVRRRRRHVIEQLDHRLHPRRQIGIIAREIDIGIEPAADIEGRVGMRLIGIGQPEQLPLRDLDEVIALEPLLRRQLRVREGLRLGNLGVQKVGLALEPGRAPIGQLAVEFVLAFIDRERRIELEPAIDVAVDERRPIRVRRGRAAWAVRNGGRILACAGVTVLRRCAARQRRHGDRREQEPFYAHHSLPESFAAGCWQLAASSASPGTWRRSGRCPGIRTVERKHHALYQNPRRHRYLRQGLG